MVANWNEGRSNLLKGFRVGRIVLILKEIIFQKSFLSFGNSFYNAERKCRDLNLQI